MSDVTGPQSDKSGFAKLLPRVLSALLLAPVVIGLVYLSSWTFALLIGVGALLVAYEWSVLTGTGPRDAPFVIMVIAVAAALYMLLFSNHFALAMWVPAVTVILAVWGFKNHRVGVNWWPAIGFVWIIVPTIALISVRMTAHHGLAAMLWLLFVVWGCDICAFFAGKIIGGPKLAPRVSPKKTWAGLFGGMLGAALAGVLVTTIAGYGSYLWIAIAGALLAGWSQVGDLAQSAVKRHFKVKDSGSIIPGHGGMFDRVDGLMFAAPVLAALLPWLTAEAGS